jgi:hypothetical protein
MNSVLSVLASALSAPPPWLSPYVPVAQKIVNAADCESVADALNAVRDHMLGSLRFVDQTALPAGESYEAFIARTGSVPTRDNLHDLFNGLMWLCYPKTKRRLNELQAAQISLHGTHGARGPLRDALTLFDENAALLQAPAVLVDALRRRDWPTLFVEQRAQWQAARLRLFGHALMEKLMQPRKAITAHVWLVDDINDATISASLDPNRLAAKDFMPLPVLGVPGWWLANEAPDFYHDAEVFRPLR